MIYIMIIGYLSNIYFLMGPEFIRHYLVMQEGKKIGKNNIYTSYKRYFHDHQYITSQALRELSRYAVIYHQIINARTADSKLNHVLSDINTMGKTVTYPYFLKLLKLQQQGQIDFPTIVEIGQYIESYLYRAKICNHTSHGQNGIFTELCKSKYEGEELRQAILILLDHGFPSNTEFKRCLQGNDLYRPHAKKATKMALMDLEKYFSRETIDFDEAQIEHIMPQSLNTDWKSQVPQASQINQRWGNTLGNLTLTKYNQNLGNADYDTKLLTYQESNIYLTRKIAKDYPRWNQDSIITRSKSLSQVACHIWPVPASIVNKQDHIQKEYPIMEEAVHVTGHKPSRLIIGEKGYQVTQWKQLLIILLNRIWEDNSMDFARIEDDHRISKLLFKDEYFSPVRLKNDALVETCFSSKKIIHIMQRIAKICNLTHQINYVMK